MLQLQFKSAVGVAQYPHIQLSIICSHVYYGKVTVRELRSITVPMSHCHRLGRKNSHYVSLITPEGVNTHSESVIHTDVSNALLARFPRKPLKMVLGPHTLFAGTSQLLRGAICRHIGDY